MRERKFTRTLGVGDGGEEGHEAGAAEELGDEDGGVGLSLRALNPLNRLPQYAILIAAFSKNSTSVAAHLNSTIMFPTIRVLQHMK